MFEAITGGLVGGLIAIFIIGVIKKVFRHIVPKTTEAQKQTDELITVILPTINDKK